jgi:hypothetical protein
MGSTRTIATHAPSRHLPRPSRRRSPPRPAYQLTGRRLGRRLREHTSVREGQTSHEAHARASRSMAGVGAELEVWDRQGLDGEEGVGPGQGGQGIVGHWTYEGVDRRQKTVTDVAVKQALRAGR